MDGVNWQTDHIVKPPYGAIPIALLWRTINEDGSPHIPLLPADWPYGPPAIHESCCLLFEGHLECDCKASDSSNLDYGFLAWDSIKVTHNRDHLSLHPYSGFRAELTIKSHGPGGDTIQWAEHARTPEDAMAAVIAVFRAHPQGTKA